MLSGAVPSPGTQMCKSKCDSFWSSWDVLLWAHSAGLPAWPEATLRLLMPLNLNQHELLWHI